MKGVPEGASALIPRLYCRDPAAEMDFCMNVWTIATRIEETTAQERSDRWEAIKEKSSS